MANNRQIPALTDLAFEALLRYRTEIIPNTLAEYDVLMRYKLNKEFLQAIADGNQSEVEAFINDNPHLAAVACGRVITLAGDTIENVSAVELAYVVEDEGIANVLLTTLSNLQNGSREKADQQLAKKIAEVKKQESQFKKYDFTALVNAITNDQMLKDTGKASSETEKAFAVFKEYFKPQVVTKGRPFNMKDLLEAYEVLNKNWSDWSPNQLKWFLHNVIHHLLGRVSASYGQAFCQGLGEKKEPLMRSLKLRSMSDGDLSYYDCCHSSSFRDRDDFFVDIYWGWVSIGSRGWLSSSAQFQMSFGELKTYVEQKDQTWKNLSSNCSSNYKTNLQSY